MRSDSGCSVPQGNRGKLKAGSGPDLCILMCVCRQPASAKWYDRRDYVFVEFCVEDSKDVNVNFEKSKLTFRWVPGASAQPLLLGDVFSGSSQFCCQPGSVPFVPC